jgi:hypothetical protein
MHLKRPCKWNGQPIKNSPNCCNIMYRVAIPPFNTHKKRREENHIIHNHSLNSQEKHSFTFKSTPFYNVIFIICTKGKKILYSLKRKVFTPKKAKKNIPCICSLFCLYTPPTPPLIILTKFASQIPKGHS